MRIGTLIAIYFVVWWIVLFAVLPWGMRTQGEAGSVARGTEPSAPIRPMLIRKAIATSIVAAILVGALWLAVVGFGLDLEAIANRFDLAKP
jgi:predicted secreted protein